MEKVVKTEARMGWEYETDPLQGICRIAQDEMTVTVKFKTHGSAFYDVNQIQAAIEQRATEPVAVEELAEWCKTQWPDLSVVVRGRAASHGWITVEIP